MERLFQYNRRYQNCNLYIFKISSLEILKEGNRTPGGPYGETKKRGWKIWKRNCLRCWVEYVVTLEITRYSDQWVMLTMKKSSYINLNYYSKVEYWTRRDHYNGTFYIPRETGPTVPYSRSTTILTEDSLGNSLLALQF